MLVIIGHVPGKLPAQEGSRCRNSVGPHRVPRRRVPRSSNLTSPSPPDRCGLLLCRWVALEHWHVFRRRLGWKQTDAERSQQPGRSLVASSSGSHPVARCLSSRGIVGLQVPPKPPRPRVARPRFPGYGCIIYPRGVGGLLRDSHSSSLRSARFLESICEEEGARRAEQCEHRYIGRAAVGAGRGIRRPCGWPWAVRRAGGLARRCGCRSLPGRLPFSGDS